MICKVLNFERKRWPCYFLPMHTRSHSLREWKLLRSGSTTTVDEAHASAFLCIHAQPEFILTAWTPWNWHPASGRTSCREGEEENYDEEEEYGHWFLFYWPTQSQ